MLPRHHRWAVRSMSLVASYEEYWGPLGHHPASARLQALGRERDDVSYWITRNSIPNVIHAAGAIEYTVGRLESVFEKEQRAIDEHLAAHPLVEDVPTGWVGVERDAIQFEFSNLLFWLKALQERITAVARDEAGTRQRIGLLNHLAADEPWTSSIRDLYGRLQQRILRGNVQLANFVTHVSVIPYPHGSARLERGRLFLAVPDPPSREIRVWDEFEFELKRDALSFARECLVEVERFVDGMLDALDAGRAEIEERRASNERSAAPEIEEKTVSRPRPDEIDARLWVRIAGSLGFITGNCHTHLGHFSVWIDDRGSWFSAAKYQIEDASEASLRWIEGFLSGNEPSFFDYYGYHAEGVVHDDDPRWDRLNRTTARFRKEGGLGRIAHRAPIVIPAHLVEGFPQIWYGGGETTWLWDGHEWLLADEDVEKATLRRGKVCAEHPTCGNTEVEVAPDLWICPECGQLSSW